MTKNIIVLVRLLEHGEVSTNDFAGLEKVNVRHLPKIIFDARKFIEIYSIENIEERTAQSLGVKYVLPIEQYIQLKKLIELKITKQLKEKKITRKDYEYIQRRITNRW